MTKPLSSALFFALFALALGGCAETIDGACNSCPGWNINTDGCAEAAMEAGCQSSEVVTVNDDDCGLGAPPMEHLSCRFTGCAEEVMCATFSTSSR